MADFLPFWRVFSQDYFTISGGNLLFYARFTRLSLFQHCES